MLLPFCPGRLVWPLLRRKPLSPSCYLPLACLGQHPPRRLLCHLQKQHFSASARRPSFSTTLPNHHIACSLFAYSTAISKVRNTPRKPLLLLQQCVVRCLLAAV